MTQRAPPPLPPVPNLSGYRPFEERHAGAPPPIEHRFGPPSGGPRLQPHRQPPARKRRSWLRIVAWTCGGLVALTTAGIAALVAFAPVGILREQLIREVNVRTGRDLVIAGPASLSVWPSLAISMGDVSLSTPPGMGGAPFVKMKRLDASVALMPLLSRKLEIKQIVLSEPVFELRVDAQGRRTWDFAALAITPTIQYAQAPRNQGSKSGSEQSLPPELEEFLRNSSKGGAAPPAAAPNTNPATSPTATTSPRSARRSQPVQDIALGDIRIDNGTIRYRDDRGGAAEDVQAINLRLKGKSLATPLEAKGDLALRGEKIDVDARLSSPKALLEERPSRVALTLTSPRGGGRYDGSLNLAQGPQFDGAIKLDTTSVRGFARWIGANLPDGPGLGAFTLESELKTGPTWLALTNAKARLDQINATGSVNLDVVGGRPTLKTNLRIGALDLNAYLPRQGAEAQPAAAPTKGPGPQVRGFTQRSGWSEVPFDLGALGLLDAEARIAIASIAYQDLKIGGTQLGIALKNRAFRANLEDMRLYDGQGRGVVTLDGNARVPAIAVNLTLDGVSGLAFLKDAAGFEWIDGKTRLQIAVGGQGSTERAIVESLNGKAEVAFADGAIVGYNIPLMIRGVSQGRLPGFNRVPTERTDFTEAGASFVIKNGIAETKDIRALNPHVRLTGAGTANLGQRQVDVTLRPRIVGAPSGQAGPNPAAGDLSGLELPVRIRGPWEQPQIRADMDSLLKNPGQAMETIREIGKQLQQGKSGSLNKLIDQFSRR